MANSGMHSFAMLILECITEKAPFSDLKRYCGHSSEDQQETMSASTRWTGSVEAVSRTVYGSHHGSISYHCR